MAVVLGPVIGVLGDERQEEFLDGCIERVASNLFEVGDGFECLHGVLFLMGIKKSADPGGRAGMDEW